MNLSCSAPQVYPERCNGCGLCVQVCSCGVLVLDRSQVYVNPERHCDGCGMCEEVCTQDAIDCPFEIVWEDDVEQESPNRGESSA